MKVGCNGSFHHVLFQWSGNSVVLTRQNDYVTELTNIVLMEEEYGHLKESEQEILLLRFHDQKGHVRTLFIDNDPVQTNVREVAGELKHLDEVIAWLLPPGYTHRQGDVGLYRREQLPSFAEQVPPDLYSDRFAEVLSKRHGFEPADACQFYVAEGQFYVLVVGRSFLIHPEHPSIPLDSGLYELIGARGTPLPKFDGLRAGESPSLEKQ